MDTQDRLARVLGLEYNVSVHKSGGRYLFFIRELGLRHADASLERGYAEMQALKDEWLRGLAAEGLWDWIVEPGERAVATTQAAPGPLRKLLPFFIKLSCVSFVLLVLVAFISSALREVGYGLEKKLDSIVLMSPDKVEQHRGKARAIAEKLRPIVLEILGAFEAGSQVSGLAPGQANATAPSAPATAVGAAGPGKP
ncbi:MAG: hypothetical protein A2051_05715 [Desulfovibrionales bacterium GWA2_65_9]|nr:MAG: hypothetical protein A2051_05715 [Desulfovibrionales bacterium GWA2_65_9]